MVCSDRADEEVESHAKLQMSVVVKFGGRVVKGCMMLVKIVKIEGRS